MSLFIALSLCGVMDAIIIYQNHKKWLIKGKTVEFFPAWKGTKKPFDWFCGWSIAKCVTDWIMIFAYVLTVITSIGKAAFLALIPVVWTICSFFEMIIYAISETIAVSIVRRKNPQPDSEESDTDAVAKEVTENADDD